MLNETEKMKKLLSRVEQFTEFAKKAKSDSEKEQLEQDSEDLKQDIKNSKTDKGFSDSLIKALMSACMHLSPAAPAYGSDWPMLDKINNRIQTGLEQASDIMDNITCIIVNNAPAKPKSGVIGKGKLIDGNTFLEYADGGKLVYRADLGNQNKSTYFTAGQKYKNMDWDDAIVEIHPIGEQNNEQ